MAVVLVTGGSSGIGLATVRRLAAAGHTVFAAARQPERNGPLPDGAVPLVLDVGDPRCGEVGVGAVLDQAGRLDVLVNNAGTGTLGPMEEIADDEAHRIMEVNLFGPMRLAHAAVKVMRAQGGGRIINVTSMNDVLPAPFGGWYSASKAALASASAVLDAEVHGFGIHVTVLALGLFRTEMSQQLDTFSVADDSPYREVFTALMAQNHARIPSAADPDEVAQVVERCVTDPEPPFRVVVGADAQEMDKLVRTTEPADFTRMLRDYVAQLTP